MAAYSSLSGQILAQVDSAVRLYTVNTYHTVSDALMVTTQLASILYIAFYGIGHMTGQIGFDPWRLIRHLVLLVVVSSFVSNWDFFALYFGNVCSNGPQKLMSLVSDGSADPNTMLGNVFDHGMTAAYEINSNAGIRTLGFLIIGYTVFYMTIITVGYALFLLVLSRIALAILLGLAPLFFLFVLFDATRDFFIHYLRQLFNFALIPLFTSAVLVVTLQIPMVAITQLQVVLDSHAGRGGIQVAYVLLAYVVVLGLLHQVMGFAAGISGGGFQLHPGNAAPLAMAMAMSPVERLAKRTAMQGKVAYRWAKRRRHQSVISRAVKPPTSGAR